MWEVGPRYISIGADALETARAVAAAHGETLDVIDADADVAVVAFDAASFDGLSEQLHERFHRCGGFLLHDSIDDARASLHTYDHAHVGAAIDYTLDHAATVQAVLPALDQAQILETIVLKRRAGRPKDLADISALEALTAEVDGGE